MIVALLLTGYTSFTQKTTKNNDNKKQQKTTENNLKTKN